MSDVAKVLQSEVTIDGRPLSIKLASQQDQGAAMKRRDIYTYTYAYTYIYIYIYPSRCMHASAALSLFLLACAGVSPHPTVSCISLFGCVYA